MTRVLLLVLVTLAAAGACRGGGATSQPAPETEAETEAKSESGAATETETETETETVADSDSKTDPAAIDIPNARLYQGVLVGGQPTADQLRAASKAGYQTIVNLRGAGEPMTDTQPALVEELGMRYVAIPMDGAAGLTRENAEALDAALASADGPVMVHCGSGNRVGGLFALRAFWLQGKSAEEALDEGTKAGMTGIAPAVRSVIEAEK